MTGPRPTGPQALADLIFEAMVRLFWGARQHGQSLKRRFGVTAAQLSALRVLEKQGEVTQKELAARLFLRGSTTSGMVDRLEVRGLLRRTRSQADRRLVRVALAPAGRDLLARIPRGQSKFGALRALVRELPEEEARGFLRTLDRMVGLLGRGAAAPARP